MLERDRHRHRRVTGNCFEQRTGMPRRQKNFRRAPVRVVNLCPACAKSSDSQRRRLGEFGGKSSDGSPTFRPSTQRFNVKGV
jgi:hypothetical protein